MNIKFDNETLAMAADPILRGSAIAGLGKQYRLLCWTMGIMVLGLLVYFFFGSKHPNFGICLVLIIPFTQLYKCESDLKWLRVIDRIQSDDKHVA